MRLLNLLRGGKPKPKAKRAVKCPISRRPRRILPSRPAMLIGLAVLGISSLGAGIGYLHQSGQIERHVGLLKAGFLTGSVQAGLVVEDVLVEGRSKTGVEDLRLALGLERGMPILGFDLQGAQTRIEALGWVRTARIERRLPNLVYVSLTERRPMGRWQKGGRLRLVDEEGAVITARGLKAFAHLPIIIGDDAPPRAASILEILARQADLNQRVHAVSWISGRRWTVSLKNGIEVQLPETKPGAAWARLAEMEREHKVLASNILTIDLRLPAFPMVKVTPDTARRLRDPGKQT
jgi:cell division protein FtsQ